MAITYRLCQTNEEFDALKNLEVLVWNMPSHEEAISAHSLHVLTHIGGIVMGAFEDEMLIGMSVAFPMRTTGQLWSHMAAVHPDYQRQGVGYHIKQAQRRTAQDFGYTQIRWTFDPAMRGNAHFNFHLLGTKTTIYHENFYGIMSDGINAGVPSDRFEVIWDLTHDSKSENAFPQNIASLLISENNAPVISGQASDDYHTVACPYDFRAIKAESLDLAVEWRSAMREVLQSAFVSGYEIVDFLNRHDTKECCYVLRKSTKQR